MSISFKIRMVNKNDLPALQELYLNLNDESIEPLTSESLAVWENILNDPDYHIIIGEDRNKIVSSVTLIIIKNITNGFCPYAIIENTVTAVGMRGNGYAGLLLEKAVEIARDEGCYKIMLMTGTKSESTLRLYRKAGFTEQDNTAFVMKL